MIYCKGLFGLFVFFFFVLNNIIYKYLSSRIIKTFKFDQVLSSTKY